MRKVKKIGLALGGGGARGLAHIGVVKVLEKEGFKPDIIVGTSMGSLVGGVLAIGLTAEEIEKKVTSFLESDLYRSSSIKEIGDAECEEEQKLSKRIQNYFRTKIRMAHGIYRPSILQIEAIEEFINYFIPDIHIEETLIPFRAIATDLKSGEAVILKNGPLRRSILASSAVPGILPSVEIDEKQLSDGGIVHSVPAGCAVEEGADLVIAVSVGRDLGLSAGFQTAVDIYARAAEIQGYYLEGYELKDADLVVKPHLGKTHWTDFSRKEDLISQGELAAAEMLPEIRELIKSASRRVLAGSVKRIFKGLFINRKTGIW